MASSTGQFLSRTDHKKARELEEARKAGTLPAERDEEGREINPHIPEFMAKAPWYLNQGAPGLKHQRNSKQKEETAGIDAWYVRGTKKDAATKYRKGACPNCGAMTHGAKDCVDRPRARGARLTGRDIKPDEYLADAPNLSYEGKRDRFAGYDPSQHEAVVRTRFELEEAARAQHLHTQRLSALDAQAKAMPDGGAEGAPAGAEGGGGGAGGGASDEGDGVRMREEDAVVAAREGGGTRPGALRMTVRNLRIREDTAKYLLNLDVNSAYYDPKTRSMRQNPRPDREPGDEGDGAGGAFAGDNFVRMGGDSTTLQQIETYAREANARGQEIHLNAEPTQVELMNRLYREKKEKLQESKANSVLSKYGGQEHLHAPDARLLLAQSEAYVEYDRAGRVRAKDGGALGPRAPVRSRYEEDVLAHNHTAVWGSFFDRRTLRWGYADDHSTQRNSYSTGAAGRRARELAEATLAAGGAPPAAGGGGADAAPSGAANGAANGSASVPIKTLFGIGEALAEQELDSSKLAAALERERQRHAADGGGGERKRAYNSMAADETTAEDMEAYYLAKRRTEDPMAKLQGEGYV